MSDTVKSENLQTVSEVEEARQIRDAQTHSQQQSQQKQPHNPSPDESTKKSISNNTNNGTPRMGSRSGSQFLPGLHNATLPSKMAIIVGLCQVAVGGAMVLTGILAIRYQSYLFHYGTGLWAGLVSSVTGMLGAMCTKRGVPKPNWLCGGRKWQIHVFLLAILLSLCSVVVLAVFSVSGLLQDAKTIMAVEVGEEKDLEEILDSKNTSGIVINTILLLLSILQILLCFSSLGIAVRVLYKSRQKGGLLSSKESTGSEVAIRELGAEYMARKDHLIHWLGHQRPNVIPVGFGQQSMKSQQHSPQQQQSKFHPSKFPTLVAIQPMAYPPPHHRMIAYPNHMSPTIIQSLIQPHPVLLPPFHYTAGPHPQMMCAVHGTTPSSSVIMTNRRQRRSTTPAVSTVGSLPGSDIRGRPRRRGQSNYSSSSNNKTSHCQFAVGNGPKFLVGKGGNGMKTFQQIYAASNKAESMISVKTQSEKNNELEIQEVDVSCTYTGLDRDVADDYICSMSNARMIKESKLAEAGNNSSTNDNDNDDDNNNNSISIVSKTDDYIQEEYIGEVDDEDLSEMEISRL